MEIALKQDDFDNLYPFFVGIGVDGLVVTFGRSAPKCFLNIASGINFADVLSITAPKAYLQDKDFPKIIGKIVTIKSSSTSITFNGEVLWLKDQKIYLFAITPLIQNVEALTKYNLTYADFSAYSPIFDFFILIQAERFARKEQNKAYLALEEQNSYAKLNLEIANFCSSCFSITDCLNFSISSIKQFLDWEGISEKCDQEVIIESSFEDDQVKLPINIDEKTSYILTFKTNKQLVITDGLKIFLNSLKFTLENLVTRIEQYESIQEAQALQTSNAKMYTLGEMAAGIAHELNNPLAVIQGHAWVTLSNLEAPQISVDQIKESMNKIVHMTERSGKIIKGLRLFARDAAEDPMEIIELNKIIEETLELCKSRIINRGIKLDWDSKGSFLSMGRSVQISQVLLNLLNNAADAIEDSVDPWIKISITEKQRHWQVSVTDSGHGIPSAILEKILSPFFTTKAPGKGTGLGLSISNSIIKNHHGDFWYDKNSLHTSFCFTLPILDQNVSAPE